MPFTMFVKNKSILLPNSWVFNVSCFPWPQRSSTGQRSIHAQSISRSVWQVEIEHITCETLSGSRAQVHRDVSDYVSFTLFPSQTVMSHSFYPPLMQRTSWTLAVPFKEQDHHRGPSDSIGNNYSLTARDMKLKDLVKVYQPVTISVPRDKTSQ